MLREMKATFAAEPSSLRLESAPRGAAPGGSATGVTREAAGYGVITGNVNALAP